MQILLDLQYTSVAYVCGFSVCNTVGVDKNGDQNKTLCSANIGQVYEAFLCALKDYTLDSRGDVGAW